MSLTLSLKSLECLPGKAERLVKASFRGVEKESRPVRSGDTVYYGELLVWVLARKIEETDTMEISVYNYNKYFSNKFLGKLTVSIYELSHSQELHFRENLVNDQYNVVKTIINFEISYISPDSAIGGMRQENFEYPVYELASTRHGPQKRFKPPSDRGSGDEDDFELLFGEDRRLVQEHIGSESSIATDISHGLPKVIGATLQQPTVFQVLVNIIQGRNLAGSNLNPYVEVTCGETISKTNVKFSTCDPYFNQQFVFDFNLLRNQALDLVVIIRVYSIGTRMYSRFLKGKIIGEFRMDVNTIISQPDRAFYGKYALIIDPKEVDSKGRGYVKCDLAVMSPGEKPKRAPQIPDTVEENIEANILLPQNMKSAIRNMAEICVKVYRAEDIPCMNTDIVASIKQAIVGNPFPMTDPFVEVSFSGHSAKTKSKNSTYTPEWNQEVAFTEMFPPYCSRIRLSLYDWDAFKNEMIATHFFDIERLWKDGDDGFLPVLGPSWINLYGTPREFSYKQSVTGPDPLNESFGEGAAYRGRLLVAIKTSIRYESDELRTGAQIHSAAPASEMITGKREGFFLFGSLFEASVIHESIGKSKKPIQFELSIGLYGNTMDKTALLLAAKMSESERKWTHSLSEPFAMETNDNIYYHIPFGNKKPCLFTRCYFEDNRPRMCIPNVIDKLRSHFDADLDVIQAMLDRQKRNCVRRFQRIVEKTIPLIDNAIQFVKTCRGSAPKTLLDKERQRTVRSGLNKMKQRLNYWSEEVRRSTMRECLRECRSMSHLLEDYANDPQHGLPDVFLWLLQDNKRVAYARIKAREIFFTLGEEERGKRSAIISTLFLKRPGQESVGAKGWAIQTQVQIYFWLGFIKDVKKYRCGLPEGYDEDILRTNLPHDPPMELSYPVTSSFRLRCYIYMARNVVGTDDSGLSDPFVRVLINEHVIQSSVKNQTLSPFWDEVLTLSKVTFCYEAYYVQHRPPPVVVELFDYDSKDESNYLGRAICYPSVFLKKQSYKQPKLRVWKAYRGQIPAGELLACFDLIELNDEGEVMATDVISLANMSAISFDVENTETVEEKSVIPAMRVPRGIRPARKVFRMEVMIWGVRDIKPILFMDVEKPVIIIEFGSYRITSDAIKSCKQNPNFRKHLQHIKVRMPSDYRFWPPIAIYCSEERRFAPKAHVGNHLIANPLQYFVRREINEDALESIVFDEMMDFPSDMNTTNQNGIGKHAGVLNDDNELADSQTDNRTLVPLAPPGEAVQIETKPVVSKEELEEVDWWSRYYATMEDLATNDPDKESIERQSQSSDSDIDVLNGINVEVEDDDDDDEIIMIPEDEKKKKKKRRKKKKKRRKIRIPFISVDPVALYKNEEVPEDLVLNKLMRENRTWIERITYYPCPLERVKDFDGFQSPLHAYPLLKGSQEEVEIPEALRQQGILKGNFMIYEIDDTEFDEDHLATMARDDVSISIASEPAYEALKLFPLLPKSNKPFPMTVRVYVIEAFNLHPTDSNGLADPYLVVRLGAKQVVNEKDKYKMKTLTPRFGALFEFECSFPQESTLTISVYDHDNFGFDELIGETKIDLENRYYSKHYALCGLAKNYATFGYTRWRDQQLPTQILEELCEKNNLDPPLYEPIINKVTVNGKSYFDEVDIKDETGEIKQSNEALALKVLHNWDEVAGFKLVPEHIETRPLLLDEVPGLDQGQLHMWVDLFRREIGAPGAAVEIAPREPIPYVLRVIIHNTDKVDLLSTNFISDDKSSDVFVKGWIKGIGTDDQKTDIHYNSLTGEGSFNWRFIFPFDYLKAEDKIVYKTKTIIQLEAKEEKSPCILYLQCWDAGMISSDNYIGGLDLRLSRMPRGAKSSKAAGVHQVIDPMCPTFSLFRNRRVRGWWPFVIKEDDEFRCSGRLDAEFQLMTVEEADEDPAGEGRKEPQPLPEPNRPSSSFFSMFNPLKILHYLICVKLKPIIIKIFIILLILAIFGCFIYGIPGYLSKKLVGA